MAIAATMIAVDLAGTAGSDDPAVYRNINGFGPAVSGRGRGLCDPHFLEMISRVAAAAVANRVSSDPEARLARHEGWFLEKDATDE